MDHDQIPEIALEWHQSGKGAVLATVIETWGSAPRQPGSQLVISGAGEIMGSVSGGCVEGAVVTEALEALAEGRSRVLTYGVTDETAFSVGLACGGTIRVLVEPVGNPEAAEATGAAFQGMPEGMLQVIVNMRARRQPVAYGVTPDDWIRRIILPGYPPIMPRFRADRSGMTDDGEFIAIFNPPLRLLVVGAVHIAQALLPMARLAGYDPVLIDPREAFASTERFPGEAINHDWPDDALSSLKPDARTAVVTLTHDSKLDDPAIMAALKSEAFYLGCLGSTRTHAKRLERLRAQGLADQQLARIHAPVGLDIGARTPAEIAVSVLAQVTQVLRKG